MQKKRIEGDFVNTKLRNRIVESSHKLNIISIMIALFDTELLVLFVIRLMRVIRCRVFAMKLHGCPMICDARVISVQESSTLKVEVVFWHNNEKMSGHFFVLAQKNLFQTGQKLKLDIKFFFPERQLIVCDVA